MLDLNLKRGVATTAFIISIRALKQPTLENRFSAQKFYLVDRGNKKSVFKLFLFAQIMNKSWQQFKAIHEPTSLFITFCKVIQVVNTVTASSKKFFGVVGFFLSIKISLSMIYKTPFFLKGTGFSWWFVTSFLDSRAKKKEIRKK